MYVENIIKINVFMSFLEGVCICTHVIGGAPTQLKPCMFSVKVICREDNVNDPNWKYILSGVLFGFRPVILPSLKGILAQRWDEG